MAPRTATRFVPARCRDGDYKAPVSSARLSRRWKRRNTSAVICSIARLAMRARPGRWASGVSVTRVPPAHDLVDLAEARSGSHRPLRELLHLLGVLPGGQLGRIGNEGEHLVARPRDLHRGARHGATLRRPGDAHKDTRRLGSALQRARRIRRRWNAPRRSHRASHYRVGRHPLCHVHVAASAIPADQPRAWDILRRSTVII